MKPVFHRLALALLLLGAGIGPVLASAADDFRKGQKAFKAGRYEQALGWFEKARRAGMRNAAIHYNLGVTHYRLGHYREAEKAFLQTARYPKLAPLAWYNLGLVKLRQGDRKAATGWFRKAAEGTDDPRLRALANDRLAELAPPRRWSAFVYAGLGYDDNITLTSDVITVPTGKSDGFLELYANARGILSGSLRDGILLRAGIFGDFYASLSDYNYQEINAGLYKSLPIGNWRTEGGLRFSRSRYGFADYLQIASVILRGKRNLSPRSQMRLRFRLRNLAAIDNRYDYLSGTSYDLRFGARWRLGSRSTLRAYYQYQDNDRNDIRRTTYFHSVSPRRHRLRADWRQALSETWKLRLGAEYRLSAYKEDNVYYFISQRIRREDRRIRLLAEVTRKLGSSTDLVFGYLYTDNASNVGPITLPPPDSGTIDYDYTRNMFMASIQHAF